MKPQERAELSLTKAYLKGVVKGEVVGEFPEVVDNTMRSDYRKCGITFRNRYILNRAIGGDNIHLVAGGAFAHANDKFRQAYYAEKLGYDEALDAGALGMIEAYGYDEERESSDEWSKSPKSCERMLAAYYSYWHHYHPRKGHGQLITMADGSIGSEFGFLIPLDVKHPKTGKPLMYSIRADYLEERDGKLWVGDDKTTTSLGMSWAKQWDLRAQFIGYCWAVKHHLGLNPVGAIARGTGILKTSISHMEVPVAFPEHILERWWVQVNKDFQRMVDDSLSGDWDYDMSDGCTAYGGCKYVASCRSKFPERFLGSMAIRVWCPDDPEGSPTIAVEEL